MGIIDLPPELQRKILFYAMEHPTAKIIKKLKKEINEFNSIHYDIDKKYNLYHQPLEFYEALCTIGYLEKPPPTDIDIIWYELLYGWD